MRCIIMHKTNAHWESGAIPTPQLIERVGALIEELANARVFQGGEGLRATSHGVRVTFSNGQPTVMKGPYAGGVNELPAGFTILRTESIDQAVEFAAQQAEILGDGEVDIRPVNEPWDIGITPKPEHLDTTRYMVLRKATPASEGHVPLSSAQQMNMQQLLAETARAGRHVLTESMRPSARGRRYKNSREGLTFTDGPFAESKELIGGYVIVSVASLNEACRWAERYIDVVDSEEVDVRELAEPPHHLVGERAS